MDWVLYSQYVGKFDHLRDESKNMCKGAERASRRRDGEIPENVISVEAILQQRQALQVKLEPNSLILKFKQLDYVENLQEDTTYRIGDMVKDDKERFGRICNLFTINNEGWADVSIFNECSCDTETNIYI